MTSTELGYFHSGLHPNLDVVEVKTHQTHFFRPISGILRIMSLVKILVTVENKDKRRNQTCTHWRRNQT
jgi:hypothetical protein